MTELDLHQAFRGSLYYYRAINSSIRRLKYLFRYAHSQTSPFACHAECASIEHRHIATSIWLKAYPQITFFIILMYAGMLR